MKNLNFSKFLFIPLLCAGFAANAQENNLAGSTQPVAATTSSMAFVAKPATVSPLMSEKNLFNQKTAFKNAAFADGSASTFGFGLEPEVLLPLGDFKNASSVGVGINLKALYHLSDAGAVTGTIGYNYFVAKEDVTYKYSGIPIKIGYLAKLGDMFFVEPQIGLYSLRASFKDDGEGGGSASTTNLLLAAKVGINIGEKSNLGVSYNYIKVTGGSFAFAGLSYLFTF
ncbi:MULTISPECIES: hypothetical protein [unclassified Mucilaginibacter]|uniref:hypothetical protein n=1 Tax=unclassified Mucilaginibacter TaxID=2617802 RepID=UPI002AC97988|nr:MULTISPECIES: hypothetical protein [unclassified Mucilaginibacter]MEB0263310.1 hypothetical protein [Mucilaginibacter sp. 10I4]MEB0278283.1 hypothetical protein [Mucilaginibacter sp. 10B2]MEB0301218.1 hypothetical protein [Mucilaginibacter sp. 5C4]WPX23929.1 hypothetical protein RHM67_01385 [Mucilaginibacter sp. 5C4]